MGLAGVQEHVRVEEETAVQDTDKEPFASEFHKLTGLSPRSDGGSEKTGGETKIITNGGKSLETFTETFTFSLINGLPVYIR